MAKRKDFTLTEEELKALNQAIKRDRRTGLNRRATAVWLLHLGHKPATVAEMVAASVPSVYSWHERFREAGVDRLANKEKQPGGCCTLVLDNASYHTSATSRAALSLFEHRVLIIWLRPYCALELNPIERHWRHLKDQVCVNKLHPSLDELIASVEAETERQNNPNNSDRFKLLKVEV
jgi:hypothetical protein